MVVDGDTLTIDGERIRLWGVNAPEQDQTCRRHGQDYRCGEGARQALREWIGQSAVSCVEVEKDQYGCRVARCAVDGQDIGAWMVSQGLALDYRRYSAGVYARDEASARAAARGLHAGTFEPAWAWRAAPGMTVQNRGRPNRLALLRAISTPRARATIMRRACGLTPARGSTRRPASAGFVRKPRPGRRGGFQRRVVPNPSPRATVHGAMGARKGGAKRNSDAGTSELMQGECAPDDPASVFEVIV
uniref:thermonuclease family protein n=1 Tax=Brevundimonas diminuta TaxID=293 RepID=UPI00168BFE1F